MIVAKQVADLITFSRALLIIVLPWLGLTRGADGLPAAVLMMFYSWISDMLDGPIARRSSRSYHTWLGDHDLEIDMAVASGLLVYMLIAGYVPLVVGALYLLIWVIVFLYFSVLRSLGMLYQAPIYGWFIWTALKFIPNYGISIIIWIVLVVIITWPRFPKEIVPGFLAGFQAIRKIRH
jgi:cardiolipin synthase (CMP-forming)